MKRVLLSIVATCSLLNAGGYKVPEQSADSLGLAASNVAFSFGADAAYFNPANMMFLDGLHHFESTLGWFHINSIDFKSDDGKSYSSKKFDSLAGTFSFVTPEIYENWRFGLALAVPAMLALSLKNAGKEVDFEAVWGQGHGGDYDLDELFAWIKRVEQR